MKSKKGGKRLPLRERMDKKEYVRIERDKTLQKWRVFSEESMKSLSAFHCIISASVAFHAQLRKEMCFPNFPLETNVLGSS